MCQRDVEKVHHLLLHGPIAKDLWDLVFAIIGVQWVMSRRLLSTSE